MLDAARDKKDGEAPRSEADAWASTAGTAGAGAAAQGAADTAPANTRVATVTPSMPAPANPYGRRGPYDSVGLDEPLDLNAKFLEYWRIIYRRKLMILGCVGGAMAISLAWTLMMVPLYSAVTRLQIDRTAAKVVEAGQTGTGESDAGLDFLRTQFELLQSRAIAERVVSSLKLAEDEKFLKSRDASVLSAELAAARLFSAIDDFSVWITICSRSEKSISARSASSRRSFSCLI